jgi:DNA-binding SARP family transcriptional activator
MAHLEVSLLGGFSLTVNGVRPESFVSNKARALLAYLAVEANRPHRRAALASLLWPDQPEDASRANLRQALHRLNQAIGRPANNLPYLQVSSEDICLSLDENSWMDIVEFKQFLAASQRHHLPGARQCGECLRNLKEAAGLYHGDVLAGFSLPGCSDFEWWLSCRQEEYHAKAIETLDRLILHFELVQEYYESGQYAQKAIELEPWNEFYHRRKMRALALSGRRNQACRQYEICRQILARELAASPDSETTNLYLQISTGSPVP